MRGLWKKSMVMVCAVLVGTFGTAGAAVPDAASAVVEKGTAAVTKPSDGNLQVAITGNNALIKWASGFGVGQNEAVRFGWTGSGGNFVVNYVPAGIGKSEINGIMGKVSGMNDGHVWLINPSGIAFGAGANISFNKFSAIAGGVNPVDVYTFALGGTTSRYLDLAGNTGEINATGNAQFHIGKDDANYSTRLLFVAKNITIAPGVTIDRGTTSGSPNPNRLAVQLAAAGTVTITDNGELNNGTSNYYNSLGDISAKGNITAHTVTMFGANVTVGGTITVPGKGHVIMAAGKTLDVSGLTVDAKSSKEIHFNVSAPNITATQNVTLTSSNNSSPTWTIYDAAVTETSDVDIKKGSSIFYDGRYTANTTLVIGDSFGNGLITKVMPNGSIWFQTNSFASGQLDAQMAIQRNWQPSSSNYSTSITGLPTGAAPGAAVVIQ